MISADNEIALYINGSLFNIRDNKIQNVIIDALTTGGLAPVRIV